jgi:hypothetical protein
MSNSALMVPSQVNLDEFERRLRAAGSPVGIQEDPLDELARLVGLDGQEAKFYRSPGLTPKAEAPRLPLAPLLHIDARENEAAGFDRLAPQDSGEVETAADASSRAAAGDDALARHFAPRFDGAHSSASHEETAESDEVEGAALMPRRSGRMALTLGLLVTIGAVGLVAAWVVKGTPGLPKTPPVIMAADGPTKVQPPSQDTIASPNDSASVLLKDQTGKPSPVTLVSSVEQPVDLQQQANTQPTTPAAAAGSTATAAPVAPAVPAVSPSPQRGIALTTIGPTAAAPAAPAPFPEPKRVKTVSVRPDGSLISSGSEPVADAAARANAPAPASSTDAPPADAAAQPANPPVPRARPAFDAAANGAPQPATPKLDLPTKLSGKSTARVPIAKTDTTVVGAANRAPEAPLQVTPTATEKPARTPRAPANEVAAADPVATSATGAGGYSVQLAAPGTEKEAQSASARLQAKYATELGGLQPTIHAADVNGRSIYRVRLSAMTKADAVALCQKVKASGGDGACFVAKD